MLENNFIGFSKDKEYLPKDFDEFNSKNRLRQLFLNLSNNILESYCYFSKYEQKMLSNLSLEQAFSYKIKSMFPISFIKNKKIVNTFFDESSDTWLQAYDELITWTDGRIVKCTIAIDITEQKEMQASLIQTHTKLAIQTNKLKEVNSNGTIS
mgnify:CR=1 FL=1